MIWSGKDNIEMARMKFSYTQHDKFYCTALSWLLGASWALMAILCIGSIIYGYNVYQSVGCAVGGILLYIIQTYFDKQVEIHDKQLGLINAVNKIIYDKKGIAEADPLKQLEGNSFSKEIKIAKQRKRAKAIVRQSYEVTSSVKNKTNSNKSDTTVCCVWLALLSCVIAEHDKNKDFLSYLLFAFEKKLVKSLDPDNFVKAISLLEESFERFTDIFCSKSEDKKTTEVLIPEFVYIINGNIGDEEHFFLLSLIDKMTDHVPTDQENKSNYVIKSVEGEKSVPDQLRELKSMVEEGLLTESDYELKKKQILGI